MIQGAKSTGQAQPIKTAQNPNDICLMFLDKGVWNVGQISGSFRLHDKLLPIKRPDENPWPTPTLLVDGIPVRVSAWRCRAGLLAPLRGHSFSGPIKVHPFNAL